MALATTTVWEVRTTGSDSNGGGYVSGGVDYSQQASAQATGTNLTTDATTPQDVLPDGHTVTSNDIGNVIQITAGAGFTAGFYQIISLQSGNTKWRLDRAPAAASTAGGSWSLGGALLTPQGVTALANGHTLYIKSGTYTFSSAWALNQTGSASQVNIVGYDTSGDRSLHNTSTRPLLTISATTEMIQFNGVNNLFFRNLSFSNTHGTSGVFQTNNTTASNPIFVRCKFDGFTVAFLGTSSGSTNTNPTLWYCEITGSKTNAISRLLTETFEMYYCYIHDNTGSGVIAGAAARILAIGCIFDTNTRGVYLNQTANTGYARLLGCVFYNNTTAGYEGDHNASVPSPLFITNCIFYGGVDGINYANSANAEFRRIFADHNAFGGQSGAARVNWTAGANDVILSADPFVDAANGDFRLNNTSGGGAALRALGFPATSPGGLTTSYPDVGFAQHQDSGGTPVEPASAYIG